MLDRLFVTVKERLTINNLKRGRIYFSPWFQKFQCIMANGSSDCGPVVRQNILVAGACSEKSCSPHRRREAEKEKEL